MAVEPRPGHRGIFAALLLAAAAASWAQGAADPRPESTKSDFRYDLGADGEPVFTQVLRWEGDDNALEYLLVIRDAAGTEILSEKVAEARKEVRLAPGTYSYKIITCNLLGRAEAETEWIELRILRAERPRLASAGPSVLYMDSLDGRLTLKGEKLVEGAKVYLRGAAAAKAEGRELSRKGEEEMVVSFPDEAYQPGVYGIAVENPGGLSSGLDDVLRIKFQRPVDILAYAGYSPLVELGDAWFTSNWRDSFNALGFDAGLELFFVKAKWGFLGVEGRAQVRRLEGGEVGATIRSEYLLAGANLLYKYRLTKRFHALARAGGGLSFSRHGFDYDGFQGPQTTSTDPFAAAGLSLQYFTSIKLFGELGADWSTVLLKGHSAGGISPSLRIGYQIF